MAAKILGVGHVLENDATDGPPSMFMNGSYLQNVSCSVRTAGIS